MSGTDFLESLSSYEASRFRMEVIQEDGVWIAGIKLEGQTTLYSCTEATTKGQAVVMALGHALNDFIEAASPRFCEWRHARPCLAKPGNAVGRHDGRLICGPCFVAVSTPEKPAKKVRKR